MRDGACSSDQISLRTNGQICLFRWVKPVSQRVLETAGDLFQRLGYTRVGINRIIAESNVSKDGFYRNFPSKKDLCIAWLRETHTRSEKRHAEILAEDRPVPEKIEAYFQTLEDYMKCREFRGCPFSNTASVADASSVEIRLEVESHKNFHRRFFSDLIRPVVSETTAEALGDHFFLLYSGASTEAQNLRTEWPIRTAAKLARSLCEQAIEWEQFNRKRSLLRA